MGSGGPRPAGDGPGRGVQPEAARQGSRGNPPGHGALRVDRRQPPVVGDSPLSRRQGRRRDLDRPSLGRRWLRFTARPQLEEEHVLPRRAARLARRIGSERLLPVGREQHPPSVARDVCARRVPERQPRGVGVGAHVAAMVRQAPDLRARAGRRSRLHGDDLVVPRPPFDVVDTVAVGRREERDPPIRHRVVPRRMLREVPLLRQQHRVDEVTSGQRARQLAQLPLRRVPRGGGAAVLVDAQTVAVGIVPVRSGSDAGERREDVGLRVPQIVRVRVSRRGAVGARRVERHVSSAAIDRGGVQVEVEQETRREERERSDDERGPLPWTH
jgi:hypothetical protein